MNITVCWKAAGALALIAGVIACGGGGGGDGGGGGSEPPLQYSGNTSAAVITSANAAALLAAALGGGDAAALTSTLSASPLVENGQGQVDIGRRMNRIVRATFTLPKSSAHRAPFDQTDTCPNGGTVRVFGDVSASGTGTFTLIYTNCVVDGLSLTGQGSMRVDAFDFGFFIPTDVTLSFGRLAVRGSVNSDIGGSLRVQTNLFGNTETITENLVALHIATGRMTKSENLIFIDIYNNFFSPSSYTENISGRVFESVHGFVDIATNTPFAFSTLAQTFPGSGVLQLAGAASRVIRVTAGSPTVVDVALDLDGDGTFEVQARMPWSGLSGPLASDLGDSDGDGMHNSWETAFALNPNADDTTGDPDNDGFNNLAEYQAGTNPTVADATLPPPPAPGPLPPGPVTGLSIALANVSDLVYDSGTDRIYAAVRTNPGSVVPVNPATGQLGTAITVGSNPAKLARSDDGQFLYVGLDGQSDVQRINLGLVPPAVDLTIPLGSSGFLGPRYAEDIAVLPGSPGSFAVSLRNQGFSPRHEGVAIFDGATQRPQMTASHTGSNVIEFSASATTLYGYNNETTEFGFRRMAVDANGVTVTGVYDSFAVGGPLITGGFGVDMRFGGGFIFTTSGQMIDPIARLQIGTFTIPNFGPVVPDAALSRVFYLVNNAGTWNIKAFDMGSRAELGNGDIPGVTGTPGSLIRWGTRGLAFRTSDSQIFMVESTSWIP